MYFDIFDWLRPPKRMTSDQQRTLQSSSKDTGRAMIPMTSVVHTSYSSTCSYCSTMQSLVAGVRTTISVLSVFAFG